jgi:hypothetical protein
VQNTFSYFQGHIMLLTQARIGARLCRPVFSARFASSSSRVCNAVQRAFKNPLCGVHVLVAPPGSDRSERVAKTVRRLQNARAVNGALFVHGSEFNVDDPRCWDIVKHALRILPDEPAGKLSYWLPTPRAGVHRPVALVVDRFERMSHHADTRNFVVALAEDSTLTKAFTALLLVDSVELQEEILGWNKRTKIFVCDPR